MTRTKEDIRNYLKEGRHLYILIYEDGRTICHANGSTSMTDEAAKVFFSGLKKVIRVVYADGTYLTFEYDIKD